VRGFTRAPLYRRLLSTVAPQLGLLRIIELLHTHLFRLIPLFFDTQ
jgi:hypothetical protein